MSIRHRLSKVFQPLTIISKSPKERTHKENVGLSKSQKLMLETGIIHPSSSGCFHLLPLGVRALNKLIQIVDEEMVKIGGEKVLFPILTSSELWSLSGRIQDVGPELLTLQDRHKHEYILSPTYEESCSHLLSTVATMSYRCFPLLLYQISSKFRDEMKPRFGLIRAREFLMKDMYSFDTSSEKAKDTYEHVGVAYDRVFERIGVDYVKVSGSSGVMGGDFSHEYHYQSEIGDDKIFKCSSCKYTSNLDLVQDQTKCHKCNETSKISITNGIEVGHTFSLGTKYSKALNANFIDKNGKPQPLVMGSYGLGMSRILAASVEVLSSDTEITWPDSLMPYSVVIVPPKEGSKEALAAPGTAEQLYHTVTCGLPGLQDDVLLDDRTSLTVGRRLLDARRVGFRYVIVVNRHALGTTKLYELNDLKERAQLLLDENDLLSYISQKATETRSENVQ